MPRLPLSAAKRHGGVAFVNARRSASIVMAVSGRLARGRRTDATGWIKQRRLRDGTQMSANAAEMRPIALMQS